MYLRLLGLGWVKELVTTRVFLVGFTLSLLIAYFRWVWLFRVCCFLCCLLLLFAYFLNLGVLVHCGRLVSLLMTFVTWGAVGYLGGVGLLTYISICGCVCVTLVSC